MAVQALNLNAKSSCKRSGRAATIPTAESFVAIAVAATAVEDFSHRNNRHTSTAMCLAWPTAAGQNLGQVK